MKINKKERAEIIVAMDRLVRCCNDEFLINHWQTIAVADGDINYTKKEINFEDLENYFEDDADFADLMYTFLDCMRVADKNGGLYCNGVVSKKDKS